VCKFCNAKFYRHDILHRHYKSCRQRGDCPIPSAQPRGRRKQACDQCAATKLACDSSRPCQTCAGKGHDCSWARVRERRPANTEVLSQVPQSNSTVDASPYPSEASPSLSDESADLANEEPSPMAALMPQVQTFTLGSMPVPFLLNFVSLETKTFVDTFGYASAAPEPLPILSLGISLNQPAWELSVGSGGESHSRSHFMKLNLTSSILVMGHGMHSLQGRSSASLNAPNPPLLDDSYSQGFNVSGQDSLFDPRSGPLTGGSPDSTGLPDPMRRRLSELAMQLTDTFITLPKRHWARTTSAKIQDADKFFTLSNFQLFTQTFYHHFFPQCPIIHRPSCNLKIASLRLVLVICLAGALYSSLPEAIATAQSLLDLAEEYVFRNACFQELSKGKGSADQIQDCDAKLEAIQSAVVITFLQNWEGNEAARRRGRTERFNTIISDPAHLSIRAV
jgi:hypothetical protein